MIQVFKVTLQSTENGYGTIEEILYFDNSVPNEQCNEQGTILADPIFQLDILEGTVIEFINPDEFGPARHKTHQLILSQSEIKDILKEDLEDPRIVFTLLPNAFSIER